MGTYYITRNYKGETRFLYIFTVKSLITTAIGAVVRFCIFIDFYGITNANCWNDNYGIFCSYRIYNRSCKNTNNSWYTDY